MVTVNVVGVNGALSFSPNPASLAAGQMIVWHNRTPSKVGSGISRYLTLKSSLATA